MPVLKERELPDSEKLAKLLCQRPMFCTHIGEPVTLENITYLFDILLERRQRRTCHQYFLSHFIPPDSASGLSSVSAEKCLDSVVHAFAVQTVVVNQRLRRTGFRVAVIDADTL